VEQAAMGLRRKASSPTTFQRRLEQKNPYLFIEHWEAGKSPFKWAAEWEYLSLELSNIRISTVQRYLDPKYGRDEKSIPLASVDERWIPEDVPDDQKKAYVDFVSNLFNNAFTKPESERTAVISGKFTTEESRDIGFIRSGETEKGKRTIREGDISIRASNNIRNGSLWAADEHDWLHKTGEVCIELYAAPAQIDAAISEIKQASLANRQIRVTADCHLLAFRSEVDRSLSEPYHHQTYWLREGAFASIALQRLTTEPTLTPSATQKLPSAAQPQHSMKALIIALWAIAVAIIFHALLR
jgi:hypothetical protein